MGDKRGKLSNFELLPREAGPIVVWAARELAELKRTQVDIYAEFVTRCQALMAEYRGELEFRIPAFSSFNRFSMRKAKAARLLADSREMIAVLAETYDSKTADEATIITAEMLKAGILFTGTERADELDPKEYKALADALRSAQAAQNMSSDRKAKDDKKLAAQMGAAVDAVAKAKGMTAETAEAIKAKLLGVTG